MKRIVLLFLSLGALALVQVSLLPHIPWLSVLSSLLLVLPLALALFERPAASLSLVGAFAAGLFWDLFSSHILGQGASILVASVLVIKILKARYVRLPILQG